MAKKRAKLHSATRARQSFRDFVTRLRSSNPPVIRFKEHARSADLPGAEDWGEIRLHLIRAGVEHDVIGGARLAWREFRLERKT